MFPGKRVKMFQSCNRVESFQPLGSKGSPNKKDTEGIWALPVWGGVPILPLEMGPGDIWDQIWSLGGLPMPPKGTFWAKTGPFGAPGGPEEARYKAKVCGYHEFDQTVTCGSKFGTLRTSEVPERTFYGQNGPFLPVFDRFLELGGTFHMGYNSAG